MEMNLLMVWFKCPVDVMGRNSDNQLFQEKVGWVSSAKLIDGMEPTFRWISSQISGSL